MRSHLKILSLKYAELHISFPICLSFPAAYHFPLKSLRRSFVFSRCKISILVCIPLCFRFLTCFHKEACTTRSCCVRPPSCLSSSLQRLLNWWADLSSMSQKVSSLKDRMLLWAFTICIAVYRREVLFPFQLRHVLISSSFISYQWTEANRFHHFCFYFFLSSALAYTFYHLLPLSKQCCSPGRSCCLSSCYFDQYSCLCSQLLIF